LGFTAARDTVKRLDSLLRRIKTGIANDESAEALVGTFRDTQLQLLFLRRAHRAMVKATDAGRASEAAARRVADVDHAHLDWHALCALGP